MTIYRAKQDRLVGAIVLLCSTILGLGLFGHGLGDGSGFLIPVGFLLGAGGATVGMRIARTRLEISKTEVHIFGAFRDTRVDRTEIVGVAVRSLPIVGVPVISFVVRGRDRPLWSTAIMPGAAALAGSVERFFAAVDSVAQRLGVPNLAVRESVERRFTVRGVLGLLVWCGLVVWAASAYGFSVLDAAVGVSIGIGVWLASTLRKA